MFCDVNTLSSKQILSGNASLEEVSIGNINHQLFVTKNSLTCLNLHEVTCNNADDEIKWSIKVVF